MNKYNMYALIGDNGIVEAVRPYKTDEEANDAINLLYMNGKAVCVNNYLVWEGDLYDKGDFKHYDAETDKWEVIPIEKTEIEELAMKKNIIGALRERISFLEKKLKENGIEV